MLAKGLWRVVLTSHLDLGDNGDVLEIVQKVRSTFILARSIVELIAADLVCVRDINGGRSKRLQQGTAGRSF
jgi:hypothetical protein